MLAADGNLAMDVVAKARPDGYARIGRDQVVSTPEEFTKPIADETANGPR